MHLCLSRRKSQKRRLGIAATEFAICLPFLMTVVLGTIEAANFIHLRQVLTVAGYEAALRVTALGSNQEDAQAQGQGVLQAYNINDGTITFSPNVDESTATGTAITVTVTISRSKYANSPMMYFLGSTLSSTTTMMRL